MCGYCKGIEDEYQIKEPVKIPVAYMDIPAGFWGKMHVDMYLKEGYMFITGNNYDVLGSETITNNVKWEFCPMCGRKLEEKKDKVYV